MHWYSCCGDTTIIAYCVNRFKHFYMWMCCEILFAKYFTYKSVVAFFCKRHLQWQQRLNVDILFKLHWLFCFFFSAVHHLSVKGCFIKGEHFHSAVWAYFFSLKEKGVGAFKMLFPKTVIMQWFYMSGPPEIKLSFLWPINWNECENLLFCTFSTSSYSNPQMRDLVREDWKQCGEV